MTNDKAKRQAIIETLVSEIRKQDTNTVEVGSIADAIIDRLSELQPVNKTDSDLVQLIKKTLESYEQDAKASVNPVIYQMYFESVAREIASILPRREADKELLEALKNSTGVLKSIMVLFEDDMALTTKFGVSQQIKENEAIRNAEKETK